MYVVFGALRLCKLSPGYSQFHLDSPLTLLVCEVNTALPLSVGLVVPATGVGREQTTLIRFLANCTASNLYRQFPSVVNMLLSDSRVVVKGVRVHGASMALKCK